MTAIASRFGGRATVVDRWLSLRVPLSWEMGFYAVVLAAAAGLRFWDLGDMALHHDESIHAQWSWRLAQGDYTHSPVFHGPLYYHAQGLVFLLFGASDYTARVSAALFGMGLVALPLAIRRWLGPAGTMAAVAFITFSPTIVYFSRFLREDIYFAFFTMVIVVAMWRYMAEGRDRWLILFAVGLTGSYTTKEAAYLTSAVFLVFLDVYLAAQLASRTLARRSLDVTWRRVALTAAIAPYAWVLASFWPFLGRLRRAAGWDALPRPGDLLILLGTLTLPLLAAFAKGPLESGLPMLRDLPLVEAIPVIGKGIITAGRLDYPGICNAPSTRDVFALGGLFAVFGSAAALVGLHWRPKTWALAAGLSAAVYLTLMTSFWTNVSGLCTGPWGSLDYWVAQQEVKRGNQPWFYYLMLMPMYEFLPLVIAAGGVWWSVVRGNAFSRFLAFWLVGYWIALSSAGEKMPWLNTHIALPAALLAAWTVNRAWVAWQPHPGARRAVMALASLALVSAGAFMLAVWEYPDDVGGGAAAGLRLLMFGAIVLALAATVRAHGRRALPVALVVVTVGALAFFSLRTMVVATFERGDVPDDLLVYTQSSPDVARLASQIDRLAEATGKGLELRIVVDTQDSFAWPWAWYLRDYRQVRYAVMSGGVPDGQWDVLLVNAAHVGAVNESLAQRPDLQFGPPTRYPHRWWFDERYKSALPGGFLSFETWGDVWEGIGSGWLKTWFRFWRDKEPGTAPGSVDAYAFFPANFDPETGMLGPRQVAAPEPGFDAAGRPFFGGLGPLPGQFFSPRDLAVDGAGNIYVIDATTKKLSKFDPTGHLLNVVDVRVDPSNPGEASDPWGVSVAPDGRVIVADTFGWRVRVFSADLEPLATIGGPPSSNGPPGPFELFGPRDAAVDTLGRLWVTDTGHHRIVVYTLEGEFVMAINGGQGSQPGQFSEPVGIDISPDGEVFVADMYNARVQILDLEGNYVGEFAVPGWGGTDPADKPYLRVLADGRIAVSLPRGNEVRVYDRSGALHATIAPQDEPLRGPYGIVQSADGRLWIAEGESARVRLFDIP